VVEGSTIPWEVVGPVGVVAVLIVNIFVRFLEKLFEQRKPKTNGKSALCLEHERRLSHVEGSYEHVAEDLKEIKADVKTLLRRAPRVED